jgi:hypothetical protein
MTLRAVRTHYFHANASAIGGYIEKPLAKIIPVQSPTSLSPSGGADEASTADFHFDPLEEIMSARVTRSRVEGTYRDGRPTTRAMALVEDLNVLNVIRADVLFAYISSVHPGAAPDVPIVKLDNSTIRGLRVGGASLKVHLNTALLDFGDGKTFPPRPHLRENVIWERAGKEKDFAPGKEFLQCSLVSKIEIDGNLPGRQVAPNIIEIDHVGRMHLAELLVSGNSYELIMMRLELGCPVVGQSSNSATKVNGGGGGP